jgi:hypothetical protein
VRNVILVESTENIADSIFGTFGHPGRVTLFRHYESFLP